MPSSVDVYRDWLKIQEPARPLNHYQLLRLKQFVDDPAAIRSNHRQLTDHVKKRLTGEHAQRATELIEELNKAMLCLTDSRRKAEYDTSLGRTVQGERTRRSVEALLVGRKVIDNDQLEKARKLANTLGTEVHVAVIQQKLAPADVVMQAYAESLGLPYIDLGNFPIDPELVPKVPAVLARQHSFAPLLVDGTHALIAAPTPLAPDVEEQLRLRLGKPVRAVICTPAAIHDAIEKFFPREAAAAQMAAASVQPAGTSSTNAQIVDPVKLAEKKKAQLLALVVAFNFPFIAYMITATSLTRWNIEDGMFKSSMKALGLSLVATGITWVVQKFKG